MARRTISASLIADIKNSLNITWDDTATDANITNMIQGGINYLNGKNGEEADYESDGLPRDLLFEYVRYRREGALDVFENNYLSMILAMQNRKAVNDYEEMESSEQTGA